jgi:O-acetylserine/cysteine efflux transporter
MSTNRNRAVAALTASGLLWGTTVPLSKLALEWLPPGWLTAVRFGVASVILLALASRRGLRDACTPVVLASGAVGYGGSVLLQNAGISRTSVTQAALLIGAVPVLVAVIAALWHHTVARPVAWVGFAVSLAGVALVTGGRGGGATLGGDALVLASLLLSATFTVAQARMLRGRDPVSVTAVQFLGAALAALVFSAVSEGLPPAPHAVGPVLVVAALTVGGTLLPFTLFAYGQSRVSAEVAGAFVNIEPLVGAVAGIVLFGNPAGPAQVAGGAAILGGIALSSLPLIGSRGSGGALAPLAGQQAVDDLVAALVGKREALAEQALLDEPQAAGQRPAPLVGGIGMQRDAVEVQLAERMIEKHGHGPGGQPATLVAAVEPVADLGAARIGVDVQADGAGQVPLVIGAHRDRDRQFRARQPVPHVGLEERARFRQHLRRRRPRLPPGEPLAVGHDQVVIGLGQRRRARHQGLAGREREAEQRRGNRGHGHSCAVGFLNVPSGAAAAS